MNDDTPSSGFALRKDPFLPILLLALSYIVLTGWQISNITSQRQAMEDTSVRQQQAIAQSNQAQAALQRLASDLIQAAQTDDQAKAIVAKFGIQQNGAPAAPPPSAP